MTSDSLDFTNRAKHLDALEEKPFDVIVIGAGATGAGIARDAAMRGLSVALLEARDFASGTSSRSSKLIHGGLRYLAQGELGLVQEAASERQILRNVAPHLARITPFIVPAPSTLAATKLRAGLWTFEKLGSVPPEERHEYWSARELAQKEPTFNTAGLNGAIVYSEFLTDDARLTLANVRSASAAGAIVTNYTQVTNIIRDGEKAVGVIAKSMLHGDHREIAVRGRMIVNAAGPWVDAIRALEDGTAETRLTLTKGIHIVFERERVPITRTTIITAPDKRTVFVVPRGEFTYIGTTDTFYPEADYWPKVETSDISYLFDTLNNAFNITPITSTDVVSIWSGIRPLISQPGKKPSEISRKDEDWMGPAGILTIAGGKLTAFRKMAERIVDKVADHLDVPVKPCETETQALPGGDCDMDELQRSPIFANRTDAFVDRISHLYGSESEEVVNAGGTVTAEAEHAVLKEGAVTLEDYWVRRSARAWFDHEGGMKSLAPAADKMASLLHWSPEEKQRQIDSCRDLHEESLAALP